MASKPALTDGLLPDKKYRDDLVNARGTEFSETYKTLLADCPTLDEKPLPLASAVVRLVKSKGSWEGTPEALLVALQALPGDRQGADWPKDSAGLVQQLGWLTKRLADESGVEVTLPDLHQDAAGVIRLRQKPAPKTRKVKESIAVT